MSTSAPPEAGAPAPTWRVRPDAEATAAAYRQAGEWVAAALRSGARHVVFDLADARQLDFTSFALVLDRLRAAGRTVTVLNIAPHLAVGLRELGLTHGARVEDTPRRFPRPEGVRTAARAAEHTLAA